MLKVELNIPPELVPLVPDYIKRREEEIKTLLVRLEERDFERIYAIAHKLTGNGAGYGMPAISTIGQELGSCAKAKHAANTLECIVRLREVIQAIKIQLS